MRGPAMIEEAAAGLGGGWRVSRKLAGGWNQGAYLVRGPGRELAVLKCYTEDPERIAAAAPVIRAAREHGWPTPAWLATGTTRSGAPLLASAAREWMVSYLLLRNRSQMDAWEARARLGTGRPGTVRG